MAKKVSDETRQKENASIVKHLQAIEKIVAKKCKRCDNPSCMGCIFGPGELMDNVQHGLELMKIVCDSQQK